jgi:hypothetical protein
MATTVCTVVKWYVPQLGYNLESPQLKQFSAPTNQEFSTLRSTICIHNTPKVLNLPVAGNVPLFRDTYVMTTSLTPYPFPYLMAHCHHKMFLRNKLISPSLVLVITITNWCT